jgi:hypothetical protein
MKLPLGALLVLAATAFMTVMTELLPAGLLPPLNWVSCVAREASGQPGAGGRPRPGRRCCQCAARQDRTGNLAIPCRFDFQPGRGTLARGKRSGDAGRAVHALAEIGELIESGRFSLPVAQTFPLADIAEAHRVSENGHVRGKLVLLVG